MFARHYIQYLLSLSLASWTFLNMQSVCAAGNGIRDAIDFEFNGRVDADIAKYERALKDQPNSVLLHLQLGQLLLDQKGDVDKAIVQFEDTIKIEPTCGSCRLRLERAILLKEKSADDLILEANQYYVNKQYKRAEALYKIAVQNYPQNAQAHNCLAWTLYKEGNLDEGLKEIRKCLHLKPDDPEFINTLGCLLYDSGDIDGALNAWHKAIALSPTASPADLYGVAVGLLSQGNSAQARKYFEQALQKDSRYADLNYLSDKIGMSVKTLSMHDQLSALVDKTSQDKAAK
jgi:tetratricopeptide (TPR) repeat protein